MRELDSLIRTLPLKEMDALLLERAIILEAVTANKVDPFDQVFHYVSLDRAMQLAAYLHRKQTRSNRGSMPRTHYIEHPLRNALRLLRYGCTDQAVVIAAILHDTVEDCLDGFLELHQSTGLPASPFWDEREVAYAYLLKHFGPDVVELVHAVTNPLGDDSMSGIEKRERYYSHVVRAIEDPRVALVKLADFIDNAASLHHTLFNGDKHAVSGRAQKYLPLVDVFLGRVVRDDFRALVLPAELDRIYSQLVNAGISLRELST